MLSVSPVSFGILSRRELLKLAVVGSISARPLLALAQTPKQEDKIQIQYTAKELNDAGIPNLRLSNFFSGVNLRRNVANIYEFDVETFNQAYLFAQKQRQDREKEALAKPKNEKLKTMFLTALYLEKASKLLLENAKGEEGQPQITFNEKDLRILAGLSKSPVISIQILEGPIRDKLRPNLAKKNR